MKSITEFEKRIQCLEKENQYLKHLLADAGKNDFANADDLWKDEFDSLRKICEINGIDALAERSRSGRGAHLWIFFQKPMEDTVE